MTRSSGRRLWQLGLFSIVLVAVATFFSVRLRSAPEVARLGPTSTTVVPGVHILCGLGPSSVYVVETSDGLVLFDSGLERNAAILKAEMARLGLDWTQVKAIFLTHVHGDHCGGAEYLRTSTKAKVYAGKGDVSVLQAGEPREAFFSTFYMPGQTPHRTHVDVAIEGGESISIGDITIRPLAMPGHTPGSICYIVEKDRQQLFFAGDVITMLAGDGNPHSRGLKPLGTYSAYLSARYRGNAEDYLDSLHKLKAMQVPDLVFPGHPLSDPTPQSPRLTAEQWNTMLDVGIRDMEALLAHYKADGAAFLDGKPKALLPNLFYLGDFQGGAVYGFVAESKLFLVDAPGGDGICNFIQLRLKALGVPPLEPTAVLLTSCNAKDTAGLKEIVKKSHCIVVAPDSGVPAVKRLCPPDTNIVTANELSGQNWFPATSVPLAGRGSSPQAYLIPWAGKQVLFSGRIPILLDHNSVEGLSSDIGTSRENTLDYILSINKLETLKPDLWLPSISSEDQNAFLYDEDWHYIISNNYRAGRSILEQVR